MSTTEIIAAIIQTSWTDDEIERLFAAVKEASRRTRTLKQAELTMSLRIGDKVTVNNNITPKALVGLTGTVTASPKGVRVHVKPDERWLPFVQRYMRSGVIALPLTTVQKV